MRRSGTGRRSGARPGQSRERAARPRLLGVVGTLVWDTIYLRDGRDHPAEEWGGVSYALEALAASLPAPWRIVPILKVGQDLAKAALRFLAEIPRVDAHRAVRVVAEPNNRVELRYQDAERRSERLSGGVPAWGWEEFWPLARECDALYVNFISGFEMELETAERLRDAFRGPIYADLHSLFLGIGRLGAREPRPLPLWDAWLRCFDAVQMNEDEFALLGLEAGDPWRLAAHVVGPDLKLITITMGSRGAACVAAPAFSSDISMWPRMRGRVASAAPAVTAQAGIPGGPREGDVTGCGDVWGATFFARLLEGEPIEDAIAVANSMAARNVEHRGARGLHLHLKGRIARG